MNSQLTLSILKPDSVRDSVTGAINQIIENNGLKIVAQKMIRLSEIDAKRFYAVHSARPFFNDLVNYMTSGPVVIQVLKGADAVKKYRQIMGATNPKDAENGTIRKLFGKSIEENSVHGSDSIENAATEVAFFFSQYEIMDI